MKQRKCRAQEDADDLPKMRNFGAWGHARFAFFVKIFLTEKQK